MQSSRAIRILHGLQLLDSSPLTVQVWLDFNAAAALQRELPVPTLHHAGGYSSWSGTSAQSASHTQCQVQACMEQCETAPLLQSGRFGGGALRQWPASVDSMLIACFAGD